MIRATGRSPRVLDLVVKLYATFVLRQIVQDHPDGKAMIIEVAIDLLGFSAPGGSARNAPIDRQRNANARASDVATADEASAFIMLVELEATRGNIAAACPGIDRIFEDTHRSAIFVESGVASNQIAAVGKPVRKAPPSARAAASAPTRPRRTPRMKMSASCSMKSPSRVLVHGALASTMFVNGDFMHVAIRPQIVTSGLQRVGNEDRESA